MGSFLVDWLQALWMILVESGPYLLVGFVVAGLLSVFVPATWIARKLGGDDVKSVATASIIGVPVPLCSCSVIPTATQLRRSGASRGATTSFLISTPETGVDSIGATWALMDPLMTLVRPLAAFITAFASGITVNLFGQGAAGSGPAGPLDDPAESQPTCHMHAGEDGHHDHHHHGAQADCHGDDDHGQAHDHGHGHDHSAVSAGAPLHRRVLGYAFGTLLDDLAPWFLVGFALSGLIVIAVPEGFFAGSMIDGWVAMVAMLFAGVPLYVCATASTPIAAAMMAKGLAPGAALVFLLAGPATNVATMLVVRDLLGKRVLAIYLISIALLSLLMGAVVNRLYPALGLDPLAMEVSTGAMEHGPIGTVSGAILGILLARSAWKHRLDRRLGRWLRRIGAPLGFDPTAPVVRVAVFLAAASAYAATAVTIVRPGETVFVERFGTIVHSATEPGAITHAPWPFDSVVRVDAGTIRTERFGVSSETIPDDMIDVVELRRLRAEISRLEDEAEMMTGDETTLVAVEYAVQYCVVDARRWNYGFSEPEELLRRLAQEALRRVVAERSIEDVLNDPRGDLGASAMAELSSRLEAAELGAELRGIDLLSAHAPPGVHSEYRSVASAMVAAEKMLLLENRRSNESMNEALIEAANIRAQAENAKALTLARANGIAAARRALLSANQTTGGAIKGVLLLDALQRSLTQPQASGQRVIGVLSPDIEVQTLPERGPSSLEERILRRLQASDPEDGPR